MTSYPQQHITTPEKSVSPPALVSGMDGRERSHGTRLHNAAVNLLFFCSGLASLICEVVWFKQLQFVLGSSTFSVSVVVASFFGGLALGSWSGGRLADRWQRLLRAYGLLELHLGIVSGAVTLILSAWATWIEWFSPWLGPQSPFARPLIILLSVALLLGPTTLMGSTLPVLTRYLVRERSHLCARLGKLYGLNTLGGAIGCGLVGFFLIGGLGVIQAALIASAIYLMIATGAFLLSWLAPRPASIVGRIGNPSYSPDDNQTVAVLLGRISDPSYSPDGNQPLARPTYSAALLIGVVALMGFASIAYEVLWFRLLTYFGTHTVYAFAGMLFVYLVGLVLGAFICARFLARRKDLHLAYFARLQLWVAVAAVLSLVVLGRSRNILAVITALEQSLGLHAILSNTLASVAPFVCFALLVLILPTTLIGIGFPLAAELTIRRDFAVGSWIGMLYSLNTLGGILGSLLVGFVLLPILGSQWSFLIIVLLNLTLFVVLVFSQPTLRKSISLWRQGVLTALWVGICLVIIGPDYLKDAQTKFEGAEILAFRETTDAAFAVLEYNSPCCGPYQQMVVNGTSYANNGPPGRRYMSTLAHLPALLHPDPKSAMVIAIGTGTTVGALTLHPEIEKIWAVDISRDVFSLAPHFVPLNHRFTESPKVQMVVADGRHFLLSTDLRSDVLTFEPPPPTEAGVVNLYSQEFYQLAKRHMNPGAILCQWVPLDCGPEILPRMMLKTMLAEFPHVSLWIPCRKEGVAIASVQPLKIDMDRLKNRLAMPLLRADTAAYGLGEPEQLAATFVAADQDLAEFVGQVPLVTDNRPRIEYYSSYSGRTMRCEEIVRQRKPIDKYLTGTLGDSTRLKACQDVMMHIWYEHEMAEESQTAEARQHIERGLRLDAQNRYLRYLLAQLEEGR